MNFTGDPFVDAGGVVIEELKKIFPKKSIMDLIDMTSNWFIHNWNGKIDSLQLNSNITHNSKRGSSEKQKKAKDSTMEFFNNLISGENINSSGHCRICGKNGNLFRSGRDIYPLSGSGAFVNYHHFHEEGLLLCNECIVKLFFLPLAVLQMGGKLALLHLHNEDTISYWSKKVIKVNLDNLGKNISDGLLKSDFSNPKNALFDMAMKMILEFNIEREYLQLYYFTNFGANPDCEIYILPNPVFIYLSKVLKSCKRDWYIFLKRYYKIKNVKWDNSTCEWIKKKDNSLVKQDEYKNNNNEVIEKLLADKSLISIFRKYYKDNFLNGNKVNILLLDYYLKEVRNMDMEQLKIIKRLGKSIVEIAKKDSNNFKKYLTKIEGASRAHQLRAVILSLAKKHYLNNEEKPMITLDEYVNYLFPDGTYWSEVRDVLLIYLYELLHEENIKGIEIEDTSIEEPQEELTVF